MSGVCPNCGAPLGGLNAQHCPACGQRLALSFTLQATPATFPSFENTLSQVQQQAMELPTPPSPMAGKLAIAARWLGGASLFLLPLSLLAIPLGLVSLSAIAQDKAPKSGIWPSVAGVFLGAWGFLWLVISIKFFAALISMGS